MLGKCSLVGFGFLMAAVEAQAALIPVGGAIPAPVEPDPIPGLVLATQAVPFSLSSALNGILTSSVIVNDATNPFGPNALTFTYLISNGSGSDPIGRFTVTDFTGFLTDVSFNPLGAGTPPTLVDRNTPAVVAFDFSSLPGPGPIPPGSASRLLVIQTNATIYTPSEAFIIDGGIASADTFGPAVPEPASSLLVLAGAMVLLGRRGARN